MLGYICNIREVEKTELVTCTCTCRRVLRKKKHKKLKYLKLQIDGL